MPCAKHDWIGPGPCPDCSREVTDGSDRIFGEPLRFGEHPHVRRIPSGHPDPRPPFVPPWVELEKTRLDVFQKVYAETKDERLRVELAIAYLGGSRTPMIG